MAYIIIHALAPIFVVMALGFLAGKAKMVDNGNVRLLNIYVMDFALPFALFGATVQTPWAQIIQRWPLIIILVLSMWVTYAVVYYVCVKGYEKSAQDASVLTLTVALPNYAALGLPVMASVFAGAGQTSTNALAVAVSIACGSVFMTPFCLLILEREKSRAAGTLTGSSLAMLPALAWRSFKAPIVLGPIIGVVLSALGVRMPEIVLYAIKPVGVSATGTALFLTGLILSARRLQINQPILLGCVAKNFIQPFIAWGIALIFAIHGDIAVTGILMIALSAGFFGVVFGNRFGVQSPDAEAVLLISSVLAIVSLPLFISLTSGGAG